MGLHLTDSLTSVTPMKKTVIKYGLISGALISAMMILAFLLIYFGVRSYRDNVAGGSVGFGRALAIGVLIAIISSACYVATWEVIYFNYMPDFMDRYSAVQLEKIRAGGASEAEIA